MSVMLRLPCIEFEARVFPHGEKSPSMIERAALAYVQSGTTARPVTFDDLDTFLGLGRPAVLELLIKLWRRAWIAIDLETRKLDLTEPLKRFIAGKGRAHNRFDGLGTTETPETLGFAYDLVRGQVFPRPRVLLEQGDQRFTYGPGPNPDRPFEMPIDGFTNVSAADFTQALREHPAYKRLIQGANLEYRIVRPEAVLTAAAVQYYPLKFQVFRTPEAGLVLRSADEDPVLLRIGRILADAIVHGPASWDPYMRKLLEEHVEEREPTAAAQLSTPTVRFRELVRKIRQAGNEAEQAVLEEQARSLWPEIESEVSRAANNELTKIEPLADSQAVQEALQRDIAPGFVQAILTSQTCLHHTLVSGSAESNGQLAAGAPQLRDNWSMLRNAVSGRGCLFLQWGADHADDTSKQQNLLAGIEEPNLSASGAHHRFVSHKSAARGIHTRASLLVRDFDTVVLSANPLLGDPLRRGMGIRLRFRREAPQAMTALLERLSLDFADPKISRLIKKRRESLSSSSVTPVADLAWPFFPGKSYGREATESDEEVESDSEQLDGETARMLRALDWAALIDEVDRRLVGSCNAETLIDTTIYETALALVKDADPIAPLVVGLSTLDGGMSAAFLEALGEFCAKAAPDSLTLLLPFGVPRALSSSLAGRLAKYRVEFITAKPGSWMPFVLSSKGCVVASDGLMRRIVNLSARSTGTQVGFLLRGPDVASKIAAAVAGFVSIEPAKVAVIDAAQTGTVRHYRLSQIHRRWKDCADANMDFNLGVSIIEEELKSSGELFADMLAVAQATGDRPLLHAVLKAAARIRHRNGPAVGAPLDDSLREFADHLWSSGDDFAAAVFADYGSLGQFATDFEREIAIAYASGGDFRGNVPDNLSDLKSSDAVWALVGLLLLCPANVRLAEQLALRVEHFPAGEFGSLIKALVDRALDFPKAPLDLVAIEDQRSVPDLAEAVAATKKSLDKLRSQDMGARNPTFVRDVLLRERTLAGELVSIVQGPPAPPAALARRMEAFFRRHLTERQFSGLRPTSMKLIADGLVRDAERINRLEVKGDLAPGKTGLGGFRTRIVTPLAEALSCAYDVLRSAELAVAMPTVLLKVDRHVLACADALVRRLDEKGSLIPRPLAILRETLRHRLRGWKSNAPQPAYWRYPALLRNRQAIASRDYAALQSLILDKEWVDDSDKSADLFRRLLDSDSFVEACHLLEIWPMRAKDGGEHPRLMSLVEDYRKRVRNVVGEVTRAVLDIRRRKVRIGLSSINIDRDCAGLLQILNAPDLADRPEVLEEAKAMSERLKEALERLHAAEAKDLVRRAGKDRQERIRALAEVDHLEVARIVMDAPTTVRVVTPNMAPDPQILSYLSMVETADRAADSSSDERLVELFGHREDAIEFTRCAVRLLSSPVDLTEAEMMDYLRLLSALYVEPGEATAFAECTPEAGFWRLKCGSGGLLRVAPHLVSETGTLAILIPTNRSSLNSLQEGGASWNGEDERNQLLLVSPFPTYGALPLVCLTTRIAMGFLLHRVHRRRLTKRALFRQVDFASLVNWRGGNEDDGVRAERLARLMQWQASAFREPVSAELVRRFVDDFCFDFSVEINCGRMAAERISNTVAQDLVVHYSGGLLLNAVEILVDGMSQDYLRGNISHVGNLANGLTPNTGLGRKLVDRSLRIVSRDGAPSLETMAACSLFDELFLNANEEGLVTEPTILECIASAMRETNSTQPVDDHVRLALAGLEASRLVQQAPRPNEGQWRVNPGNGVATLLRCDLL